MKLSNLYATIMCLLVASATVNAGVLDWTQDQTSSVLRSKTCTDQVSKLKLVWTGDCEGSYAAMVASTIQDRICIAFDKKTVTDTNLQKIKDVKISYQDLICRCEICHQFPGKGCNGGNILETIKYIKENGFVGGSNSIEKGSIDITGDIWKSGFTWSYTNCLGFFKSYCSLGSNLTDKCTDDNNKPFDSSKDCGKKPDTGTDLLCPNKESVKIKDARQKGLVKSYQKEMGRRLMKTALDKGPLVSVMDIWTDIFFWPKDKPYVPSAGGSMGYVAVKIVGYVETEASSTQSQGYWKVLLPFDETVGTAGMVLVQAGLNIGNLEDNAYSVEIETGLLK